MSFSVGEKIINAWSCCAKRLGIPKDVRILVARIVWPIVKYDGVLRGVHYYLNKRPQARMTIKAGSVVSFTYGDDYEYVQHGVFNVHLDDIYDTMSTWWEMTTKYTAPTLNGHPISKHDVREIRCQILNRLPINVHTNASPSVRVILIRQQHPILGQTQLQTFGSLSSLLYDKDALKTAWIYLRQGRQYIEGLLAMYAIPKMEWCAYLVMEYSWIR